MKHVVVKVQLSQNPASSRAATASMESDKTLSALSRGSEHYRGSAGTKYFEWQDRNGTIGGKIEARKFRPYIKSMDCVLDFGRGGGHILQNLDCARRVGVEINPAARAVATKAGIECHDSKALTTVVSMLSYRTMPRSTWNFPSPH